MHKPVTDSNTEADAKEPKKRPRASSRVKKKIKHRATLPTKVEIAEITDNEVAVADAIVDKGGEAGSSIVQQRFEEKIAPYLFQIAMMTREGSTRAQVASFLGMSTMTLDKYLKLFSKLAEAFEIGKRSAEEAVVTSLVRAATGYPYMEVKETEKDSPSGEGKICTREVHHKVQHPNVNAIIFFLINRCGSEWVKSANANHYVTASTLAIGATGISDKTLETMLKKLDKEIGLGDPGMQSGIDDPPQLQDAELADDVLPTTPAGEDVQDDCMEWAEGGDG